MTPVLEVQDLSFAYPEGEPVLKDISFSIMNGEKTALLGANGAGKSTLLWCLVGVLPGAGLIIVNRVTLMRTTEAQVRRMLGLAFSDPDDQLFMPTVGRDISFGPRAAGDAPPEALRKAMRAAEQMGLHPKLLDRAPHELSSGERRRAALAAILSMAPVVLALDEPTNSLDAVGRAELAETLANLHCAQLIATHDLGFARRICTRALVLVKGELMADEPIEDLLADEARLIEFGLLARRGVACG
jgi:cobalt/nickel transport system ATP-binding protein